jgi:hypothetical protein
MIYHDNYYALFVNWYNNGRVREYRGRGMSAFESRYQATVSEDVTVDTSVSAAVNCKV